MVKAGVAVLGSKMSSVSLLELILESLSIMCSRRTFWILPALKNDEELQRRLVLLSIQKDLLSCPSKCVQMLYSRVIDTFQTVVL